MEETLSLKELFHVIKKRLLLIIICMVGSASIAGVVSLFFLTPKYESSSQFIVNQKQQSNVPFDFNDIQTNLELINTYKVIIKSNAILDDVVKELDLPYDVVHLEKNIQVSSEQDSQVVTVKTTDTNQARAAEVANTTVTIFQKKTPEIMNAVDNITILTRAEEEINPRQVAPKTFFNIVIAIVLGAMIAVGITFLLEYLDTTITTEEDIEEKLGLSVLGVITTITDRDVLHGNQEEFRSKRRRGRVHVS